ncbi:bifunctional hydroxymethylpyrimidine kinase/phosphomethylpyrimidine kinase [Sphingobacterium griseoflavum]|uniref:hydroxymethylpyrimidine kinase n=1 Tax=Sphingobacterium griseoflavum TaxID=1474952 RepID=A0ABQ3HWP7_9SPHI|nr:bifunctional hydroxymethylpyrimidine kinase/phosphomethylpyrimidine kinase [Sphingobacterium griseoflavum]GHE33567.1 hydroxymethylpyrimidine/phosphomethylpyrimidine kinase [Sphingobacterium griseoflavum]
MKDVNLYTVPTVLSIAGFDGSGGAGIQADTKTISALGCYAMNVLTALPVQNTQGVREIYDIPPTAVRDQMAAIFDDIYPDTIKIGMVHSVALVRVIADFLRDYRGHIVLDPVMVSTSGHRLIQQDTIQACTTELFPLADLITPNLDEVSVLVDEKVDTPIAMEEAGKKLLAMGCKAVLVKGGHLNSDTLTTLLLQQHSDTYRYESSRIDSKNTHGSGCTLSSALASYLARKKSLEEAVALSLDYVHQAILASKDLQIGQGNGPLNHFHNPQKLICYELD